MFKNGFKGLAILIAVVMAVALISAPAMAEKKTLKFGVVAWSEALALGGLVEYLMEKEIGQEVEVINPDAGVAYTALMNKELDLYLEAWLPLTHETYWDKVSSSVCDFGPMYEDASLGWAVPNYIPKDVLNSVEDMDKPEVKEKCKGRIVGIDPGSGLMQHSALMMKKYPQLKGWKLVEGSDAAMVAELKRSMQRKEWIVVTLWRPHHAFCALRHPLHRRAPEDPGLRGALPPRGPRGLHVRLPQQGEPLLLPLHHAHCRGGRPDEHVPGEREDRGAQVREEVPRAGGLLVERHQRIGPHRS